MSINIREGNKYGNLVNGKWKYSNEEINIKSPWHGNSLGTISSMSKEEVDEVFDISKSAQMSWKETPLNERCKILNKVAEILERDVEIIAVAIMSEISKNKSSCISEVKRTADFIRYTADEGKIIHGEALSSGAFPGFKADKVAFIMREPVGVVLAISPFNYPVNLSASKIAPALVAGNAVILKPPTQGAISALYLVEAFREAGLPDGVLNTITGKGSEIGDYIVKHRNVNLVNFTGSSKVGKHIAEITGMIPMIMELGGKDAAIVLEDADLEEAASNIVLGAFSYSAQRCTAIKRVLVIEEIADKLVEKIKEKVDLLKIGSPEEDADITPLIDTKAADFVQDLIDDAINLGAKLVIGNKRDGKLIYPTIFDNVKENMRVAWEEPFGPVLPIIRVSNLDEAIKIANKSEYGLQSSVFTKDIKKAFYTAEKLEVGTVQINNKTERGPDHFPFSGVKNSGLGTQGIRYSIEAMTRVKNVVIDYK